MKRIIGCLASATPIVAEADQVSAAGEHPPGRADAGPADVVDDAGDAVGGQLAHPLGDVLGAVVDRDDAHGAEAVLLAGPGRADDPQAGAPGPVGRAPSRPRRPRRARRWWRPGPASIRRSTRSAVRPLMMTVSASRSVTASGTGTRSAAVEHDPLGPAHRSWSGPRRADRGPGRAARSHRVPRSRRRGRSRERRDTRVAGSTSRGAWLARRTTLRSPRHGLVPGPRPAAPSSVSLRSITSGSPAEGRTICIVFVMPMS